MTAIEMLKRIRTVKTCSRPQLHRYIKALKISPLGAKQRPQRYPEDAADKILEYLGFGTPDNGHAGTADDGKLIALGKLKKTRDAHKRKAAA